MTEEMLPVLLEDTWLAKLLTWRLPWIVQPVVWGAQWCILLERDA